MQGETSQTHKYKLSAKETIKICLKLLKYTYKATKVFSILTIIFMLLGAAFPILTNLYSSKVIDELIKYVTQTSSLNSNIIKLVLITMGIGGLSQIVSYIRYLIEFNLIENLQYKVELDYITKTSSLDQEHFDNPKTNDLINDVRQNHTFVLERVVQLISNLFNSGVRVIANVTIIFALSPIIILITIVTSAPEIITKAIYGKKIYRHFNENMENRRDYWHIRRYLTSEEALQEVRVLGIRQYLINLFDKKKSSWIKERRALINKRDIRTSALSLLGILGNTLNVLILINKVLLKSISVGMLNFYWNIMIAVGNNITEVFRRIVEIQERAMYVKSFFDFLNLEQLVEDGDVEIEKTTVPKNIRFEKINFKYPDTKKYVLEDFNLEIKPGEHIAIVGENGAGKTTIINLLMRFYNLKEGSIFIDDINLKNLKLETWYKNLGTLFQQYQTYHFDVKNNIGLGDITKMANLEEIKQAAKTASADTFIDKYEKKYDQIISKSFSGGINPSIGQKQKIAFARTLFRNAPILILDEPTSAIDPKAELEIFENLFEHAKGKTVIIISHRFSTVRNASRIIVLENGKIIENGSHEELINLNGKYAEAFNIQKKGYE